MPKAKKILSFLLCFFFIFEQSGFAQVAGSLGIPTAISGLSNIFIKDKFRPLHLRYLSYEAQSNKFNLLLDKGDEFKGLFPRESKGLSPQGTVPESEEKLKEQTKALLNYFFIGLTLPNSSFWVNLRPDGENNIIDNELAQTDVGKILLEADLQLKKDTAKYTSPETPQGKEYWDKLYQKAQEIFGNDNITIPTLIRPWIVPDEIIIRKAPNNAYIYKATLKVMLEQDYLKGSSLYSFDDPRLKALNEYSCQLIRELIIPKLTKEINASKRYASLRQVYYSLILAQWFKAQQGLSPSFGSAQDKQGTVPADLIDSKNLTGLTSKTTWSKSTYFKAYQKSVKNGEYNIQQSVYTPYGQTIKTYFSGGLALSQLGVTATILAKLKLGPVPSFLGKVIGVEVDGDSKEVRIKTNREAPSPSGSPAGEGSQSGASPNSTIPQQPAQAPVAAKETRNDFDAWVKNIGATLDEQDKLLKISKKLSGGEDFTKLPLEEQALWNKYTPLGGMSAVGTPDATSPVEKALSSYGISKGSVEQLKTFKTSEFAGSYIFTVEHDPKARYELLKKLFIPRFGVDDENYAANLFALAVRSGTDNVIEGIERALSVSERLSDLGIKKQRIINIVQTSKNIYTIELLFKDKDALKKLFVAEPIPNEDKIIADLFFQEYKERGSSIVVYPHKDADPARLEYSAPEYIGLSVFDRKTNECILNLLPQGYQKFFYKGEGSGFALAGRGQVSKEMAEVFDSIVERKGVGFEAAKFREGTSTSYNPTFSIDHYTNYHGGLWVLKKDVLLDLPIEMNEFLKTQMFETQFSERIPLKYVEHLITNTEERSKILAKYGAENTEIFGRPLKDVIIGVEASESAYRGAMLKKVVEINTGEEFKLMAGGANTNTTEVKPTSAPAAALEDQQPAPAPGAVQTQSSQEVKSAKSKSGGDVLHGNRLVKWIEKRLRGKSGDKPQPAQVTAQQAAPGAVEHNILESKPNQENLLISRIIGVLRNDHLMDRYSDDVLKEISKTIITLFGQDRAAKFFERYSKKPTDDWSSLTKILYFIASIGIKKYEGLIRDIYKSEYNFLLDTEKIFGGQRGQVASDAKALLKSIDADIVSLLESPEREKLLRIYILAVLVVIQDKFPFLNREKYEDLVFSVLFAAHFTDDYLDNADSHFTISTYYAKYTLNIKMLLGSLAHEMMHNILDGYDYTYNDVDRAAISEFLCDISEFAFLEEMGWLQDIEGAFREHKSSAEKDVGQGYLSIEPHLVGRRGLYRIMQAIEEAGSPLAWDILLRLGIDTVRPNPEIKFEDFREGLLRKYQQEFEKIYGKNWVRNNAPLSDEQKNDKALITHLIEVLRNKPALSQEMEKYSDEVLKDALKELISLFGQDRVIKAAETSYLLYDVIEVITDIGISRFRKAVMLIGQEKAIGRFEENPFSLARAIADSVAKKKDVVPEAQQPVQLPAPAASAPAVDLEDFNEQGGSFIPRYEVVDRTRKGEAYGGEKTFTEKGKIKILEGELKGKELNFTNSSYSHPSGPSYGYDIYGEEGLVADMRYRIEGNKGILELVVIRNESYKGKDFSYLLINIVLENCLREARITEFIAEEAMGRWRTPAIIKTLEKFGFRPALDPVLLLSDDNVVSITVLRYDKRTGDLPAYLVEVKQPRTKNSNGYILVLLKNEQGEPIVDTEFYEAHKDDLSFIQGRVREGKAWVGRIDYTVKLENIPMRNLPPAQQPAPASGAGGVVVKLSGILASTAGEKEIKVEGATLGEVLERLGEDIKNKVLSGNALVSVNNEQDPSTDLNRSLMPGDKISIMPGVAGGSGEEEANNGLPRGQGKIELSPDTLPITGVIALIDHEDTEEDHSVLNLARKVSEKSEIPYVRIKLASSQPFIGTSYEDLYSKFPTQGRSYRWMIFGDSLNACISDQVAYIFHKIYEGPMNTETYITLPLKAITAAKGDEHLKDNLPIALAKYIQAIFNFDVLNQRTFINLFGTNWALWRYIDRDVGRVNLIYTLRDMRIVIMLDGVELYTANVNGKKSIILNFLTQDVENITLSQEYNREPKDLNSKNDGTSTLSYGPGTQAEEIRGGADVAEHVTNLIAKLLDSTKRVDAIKDIRALLKNDTDYKDAKDILIAKAKEDPEVMKELQEALNSETDPVVRARIEEVIREAEIGLALTQADSAQTEKDLVIPPYVSLTDPKTIQKLIQNRLNRENIMMHTTRSPEILTEGFKASLPEYSKGRGSAVYFGRTSNGFLLPEERGWNGNASLSGELRSTLFGNEQDEGGRTYIVSNKIMSLPGYTGTLRKVSVEGQIGQVVVPADYIRGIIVSMKYRERELKLMASKGRFIPLYLIEEDSNRKLKIVEIIEFRKSRSETSRNVGGIDFSALPINTQPLGTVPLGSQVKALAGTVPKLDNVDLEAEWQKIEDLVNQGIIPQAESIKEYLQASCLKGSADKDIDKVLSCIADILRLEEELYIPTEPLLIDILIAVESANFLSELPAKLF